MTTPNDMTIFLMILTLSSTPCFIVRTVFQAAYLVVSP
jgi:hypothetical protein